MSVEFCSCCSTTSNHSNPTSPNIPECSIQNIQYFSLFTGSTSDQFQNTVGNFQYQYPTGYPQHSYMQHYDHHHVLDQRTNTPRIGSNNWLIGITPGSDFSTQSVYYQSYPFYNMVYPSNERFLGTSQYIPVDLHHGYCEYLIHEVSPTAYNQMNYYPVDHGYPLLFDNIKLESTEVNCTKRKVIPSCNRPARTRNVRKITATQLQCSVCFKTFTRPYNLKSHIKIHTKERPYLCEYEECKWTFARPHDLKRHQLLHLGIKPYKCACEKRFSRSDAYKRHLKTNPECALTVALMSNSSY